MNPITAVVIIPVCLYVLPMLMVFMYGLYIICAIDYPLEEISNDEGTWAVLLNTLLFKLQ